MNDGYKRRFGSDRATVDVLDVDPSNPKATVICDIAGDDGFPADAYDCFVLTQMLEPVFDLEAAVRNSHRALAPGGTLLVTVPSIMGVVPPEVAPRDYWRFSVDSCCELFGRVFGHDRVDVRAHGNVLASVAFLMGLCLEDLTTAELDEHDPLFPLIISVRATR